MAILAERLQCEITVLSAASDLLLTSSRYLINFAAFLMIILSLAEMASMYVSGFATSSRMLKTPEHQRPAGSITGELSLSLLRAQHYRLPHDGSQGIRVRAAFSSKSFELHQRYAITHWIHL